MSSPLILGWTAEEANNAFFIVKNANGFAMSYVYFEDEAGPRAAGNLMATRRGGLRLIL
jgi:hypothetical protein